ncbi:MAG: CRTAC1 family protein [Acidobacteria bacterium]|nr:CRTAC1 family protein [Acidobacteriota bacterium]
MRRWIAAALALFAVSIGGCALILGTERSARKSVSGDLYRDVTRPSGIGFRFRGDFMDGKLIPTMGSGAALADVDGDGFLDVFFVQQVENAKQYRKSGGTQPLERCSRLYRGRGGGTFEDVTERSGIRACGWGIGALFADLDSDGDVDLIVGNAGEPNSVWRNEGYGTFTKVENTGLESGRFTIGMAALDANGDGIVDVYIGHYLDTDPDRESKLPATAFKTPDEYSGQDNLFLLGLGGWKWRDATAEWSAPDPGSKTIGIAAVDYDRDGKTDLYISNDQWRNTLLHNEGNGAFRDVSEETGTGYPQDGPTAFGRRTRSGMGLAATDLDGDGMPDLFVTNYANEPNTLLRNVEGLVFEQAERPAFGGDADPSIPLVGWGTVAVDYDNDGRDDLMVTNGQILSRFWTVVSQWFNPVAKNFAAGEKSYAQRQLLFHNESEPGVLKFRDVSAVAGDLGRLVAVGRGLSAGDLDGDGRLDLVLNAIDRGGIVLKNSHQGGSSLEILPVASGDGRTVLGTRVTVEVSKRRMEKDFFAVQSYASGSWVPLHFGLGSSTSAAVSVRWPDGTVQDLGTLGAGRHRVMKGRSHQEAVSPSPSP